jgi:hypothetical protein
MFRSLICWPAALFSKLNAVKWISCVEWTPLVAANFISDASQYFTVQLLSARLTSQTLIFIPSLVYSQL